MDAEDRRAVSLYVSGVANELRRDVFMHNALGLVRHGNIVIPRAEKLAGLLRSWPVQMSRIAAVINVMWGGILYPLVLTGQVMVGLLRAKGAKVPLDSGELFVANSSIAIGCSRRASYSGPLLLNIRDNIFPPNMQMPTSRLVQVITRREVLKAGLRAWHSLLAIQQTHQVPGSRLQSYSAFHWHAMFLVLKRLAPQKLWFVSDSDSWAVLFDQVPGPQERVLVQHGLLSDPRGGERDRPASRLPFRLQNISRICVLDARSEMDFRRMILVDGSPAQMELLQNISIQLDALDNDDGSFRIIIIGQPHTISEELALARETHARLKSCRLFIKPHPSYSTRRYFNRYQSERFYVLDDGEHLRNAEAVVTFAASTLVWQYEMAGVPTFVTQTVAEAVSWLVERAAEAQKRMDVR